MDEPNITPSRWYLALAGAVLVAGWALFAFFLYKNLTGLGAKLQQVVGPGQAELTLREPGRYTIFYEYQSIIGDKVYSTGALPGLECTVILKSKNSKVALTPSAVNSTYHFGGRAGRSLFDFAVDEPGVYVLSSEYAEGRRKPEIVLAVGKDLATGLLKTIFGALGLAFGSTAMAIAIAVVTLVKRSKSKKLAASPPPQPAAW